MRTIDVEPIEVPHFKLMHIARNDMQHYPIKYRRIEKGKYEMYCPSCGGRKQITYQELKRIQKCGVCPFCFSEKRTGSKEVDKTLLSFVDDTDAVWVRYKWTFDEGIRIIDYYHCLHILNEGSWAIRSLHACMYNVTAHPDERNEPWRVSKSASYVWNMQRYSQCKLEPKKPKKQYYSESLEGLRQIVKPNQVRLLKDNLYNKYMVRNMVVFDLDYDNDIVSHKYQISSTDLHYWMMSFAKTTKLNKYYLQYLEDNNIGFYSWMDHIKILGKLHMKLEKPKNFPMRHHELAEVLFVRENEENNEKIAMRYESEKAKELLANDYQIHAFKNSEEIVQCGKDLRNCIATYIKAYANGETDLFYMADNKGKTIIAIEVQNKKLKQVYGFANSQPKKNEQAFVNSWFAVAY